MAADLQIHIFEGITEETLALFNSSCIGSKHFSMDRDNDDWENSYEAVSNTPSVWVGEVSWLKAALTGDGDEYVPSPVGAVNDIIGEDLPVIDEELIAKIDAAMKMGNSTLYSIAGPERVTDFLKQNIGKRCFTVSW